MIKWPRLGLEATLSTCSALSVDRQLLGSELYGSYFGFGSFSTNRELDLDGGELPFKLKGTEAATR